MLSISILYNLNLFSIYVNSTVNENHIYIFFNQYALQFKLKFAFHISYSLLGKFMFYDEDILSLTQMHVFMLLLYLNVPTSKLAP